MRRLALALALALALVVPVAGCPEQRPAPTPRRPPQAVIAAGAGSLADALTLRRPDGPEWFGLYLVGKKAGWTRTEIRRELRDGRDVVVGRTETLIRAGVGGKEVERRQEEERIWEARVGGRLLSFRATWAGDGGDRTVTGTCERAACKVLLVSGASRDERTIADVKETVELADAARLAAARRGTVAGSQLDLEKLRVREVRDQFVRRDTIAGGGVSEEVGVVTESEAGDRLAAEYRVADDGRILEIRLGEAVVARPEPEETARRLDRIDLFTVAREPRPGERRARRGRGRLHRAHGAARRAGARARDPRARGPRARLRPLRRRPGRAVLARVGRDPQRGGVDRARPDLRPAGRGRDPPRARERLAGGHGGPPRHAQGQRGGGPRREMSTMRAPDRPAEPGIPPLQEPS